MISQDNINCFVKLFQRAAKRLRFDLTQETGPTRTQRYRPAKNQKPALIGNPDHLAKPMAKRSDGAARVSYKLTFGREFPNDVEP
jgi:hypothetical protein